MIRIAHLSDIHLNKGHLYDAEKFVLSALIGDLRKYNQDKCIDLVLFSGDLVDKGGIDFDNDIKIAFLTFEKKVIAPMIEELGISGNRFFFCPGNHDIVRNADANFEEQGLCKVLTCAEEVNKFIASNNLAGIKRILPFKDFEIAYHKSYPENHKITNFHSNYVATIEPYKVGITCLNSCWRSYDSKSDKERIILGERQLIESRQIIDDCDLKFALIHHSLDWLAEFDKKAVRNFLQKDYDAIFCGHVHEGSSWVSTNYYGGLFVSIAPSNWSFNIRNTDRVYANGYSIIDYDILKQKITVHHRRYSHQKEAFDPNTDLGNQFGIVVFDIPRSSELRAIQEAIQVTSQIEDVYFESINEHLLSYNTDTKAPKRIEEIFVHPRLVHKIEPDPEKDKQEENLEISQLCDADENIVVFGAKESGKTILLDKILIDLTKNIFTYKKIPVYYDFSEVKGKRFETIISRFLNVGIRKIDEFLNNHKLVLLIDNLSFNDSRQFELNRLESFLGEHPNVQVIATSLQSIEGVIPADFFKYSFFESFRAIQIKSFKTKEISALIKRWFSKSELFDTPSKLNKLIDFFTTLNLPRTPLAISMFLWITEQQEKYRPINHALMLENFIERLFRKFSKKEIYSETFDFTNKQRLLAEIAKEMYDRDLANYGLPYQELSNFLHDSLKAKRFEFIAEDVLQHFLEKGILLREIEDSEVYVRFRFTCFFQYFLMKYMDYDDEFLTYVLDEDNFLFFTDEIDYFSGIKRDRSDILKLLVDRMNQEYRDLTSIIDRLGNTYDDIFATQDTVISKIRDDFVKHLPEQKPGEKEIEKLTDEFLEAIKPEKGIRKKDREISPIQRLEKYWTLSAKVLKNTEETKIPNLKDEAYKSVIKSSLAFAALYKYFLERYVEKRESKKKPLEENIMVGKDIIPLLNEIALFSIMGTKKLIVVIRDKMKNDLSGEGASDLEKFTSVFLYADLRGTENEKYLKRLVKNIHQPYIFDMTLFKLVSYYYFRSKTSQTDNLFENIIADLIVRAKGERKVVRGKIFEKFKDKGRIIAQYREKKRKISSLD